MSCTSLLEQSRCCSCEQLAGKSAGMADGSKLELFGTYELCSSDGQLQQSKQQSA